MGFIERVIRFNSTEERTEYIRTLLGGKDVVYLSHDGTVYYAVVANGMENKAYVVQTYQRINRHLPFDYAFGYKIECEDVGPHHWNAPRTVLHLLTPTKNEYALQWRAKCERTLRNRVRLQAVPPGTRVRIKDSAVDDFFCIKKRNGRMWINERRTLTIPFARLILHDVEVLGVDARFA